MRAALFLAVLAAGCGVSHDQRASEAVARAEELLRTERYGDGLVVVDRALAGMPDSAQRYWTLRLLKAELLLADREAKEALISLDFRLPPGTDAGAAARQHLYRGHAAMLLGRLDEAKAEFDTAARGDGGELVEAEVRLRQGSLAVRRGEFDAAETLFLQVLDYADRSKNRTLRVASTGNMGFLMLRSHRLEDAVSWFERTLELARQAGAPVSEARALGNLGSTYFRLGDYDKAEPYLRQAEEKFGRLGNEFEQQIWLGNLGNLYTGRGDLEQAHLRYGQALPLARKVGSAPWTATWLSNLAHTSIERKEWSAAAKYSREALELKRKAKDAQAETYSLISEARIAAGQGDLAGAEALLRKVLRAEGPEPTPALEARMYLAVMLADAGQDARAEAEFDRAIAAAGRQNAQLLKEDNRLSYLASLIRFHQEYVDFLMARRRVPEALAVVESSRARVLAGRLTDGGAAPAAAQMDFRRVARAADATILSYWLGPKRSYVWMVTPGKIEARALPPAKEICQQVDVFNAVIQAQRDPAEVQHPSGRKLREILLAPLGAADGGRVTIVPDGCLHSLNFETIPAVDGGRGYWVESVTLSTTPWIGLLSSSRGSAQQEMKPGAALLVGNAEGGRLYPALEFAAQELRAVRESAPAFQWEVLEGPRARADAYLEARPERFSLIHFAAHAAANRESPLESAIILSGPPGENRLVARTLLEHRLQADLVTVSACQSVGARAYAGEGLVGFSWVFLRAGARNVIASLWSVNDQSTAQLMKGLYGEIARGASPDAALRAAKLVLIRSAGPYRKPYYWAPFQIYVAQGGPPPPRAAGKFWPDGFPPRVDTRSARLRARAAGPGPS